MAAEIVDIVAALVAELDDTYGDKHIVKHAYSTGSLWKLGEESEVDRDRIRIYVVPVSAPRQEHTRSSELVSPEIHVAVARFSPHADDQDDAVTLAVDILKAYRRRTFAIGTNTARVTQAEHDVIASRETLDQFQVLISVVRLRLTMEVDHG